MKFQVPRQGAGLAVRCRFGEVEQMKTVQFFNDEYLAQCADMTPDDIARFLDEFRISHGCHSCNSERSAALLVNWADD